MCDLDTKVQNEQVEKKKIGQNSKKPILRYNIDHFFGNILVQIPTIISTKKNYFFASIIETKFLTQNLNNFIDKSDILV